MILDHSYLDESRRLEALRGYEILDTAPETAFDGIARLASLVFGVPGAIVSLVDESRQWFKASLGLDVCQTERSLSFCAHTIPTRRTLVVPDARLDPRFHTHPFVTAGALIFYAGAPMIDPEGHVLGTVCVFDSQPRHPGPEQLAALEDLARQATDRIVLRRREYELKGLQGQSDALRELAAGASIETVLNRLARAGDESQEGAVCGVVLTEGSRVARVFGDGLPRPIREGSVGMQIGAGRGCCGTAAAERRPVITPDIDTDPLWDSYRDFVRPFGLRACWAVPIAGADGESAGAFVVYYREPKTPAPHHVAMLESYARLAGLALESDARREATESARRAAEAASRFKGEFLATMSHEIRTPMTGVTATAELLAETPLDEGQRVLVDTIRHSGETLVALVNDVLDLSKIEAGQMRLDPTDEDLRSLLDRLLAPHAVVAGRKGVRLGLEYAAETPRRFRLDAQRVRQIVGNLVSNAVKFTPAGAVTVRVSGAGPVRIEVADTGVGIAPEALPRLFRRYEQAEADTSRRFGGSGLGLAIVRELAELMGGSVAARSEPGGGSVFTVELPLARAADAPAEPTEKAPARFRGRVLVADDQPVNRLVAERALKRLGLEVVLAEDGRAALRHAGQEGFELVLMDVQMPGLDGYETARELRRRGAVAPIVAMTAQIAPDERGDAVDETLLKPYTLDQLRGVVSRYLPTA